MKKLVLFAAVAAMVAFASCGSENKEEKTCDKPCTTEEVAAPVTEEAPVVVEEVVEEAPAAVEAAPVAVEEAPAAVEAVEEVVEEIAPAAK